MESGQRGQAGSQADEALQQISAPTTNMHIYPIMHECDCSEHLAIVLPAEKSSVWVFAKVTDVAIFKTAAEVGHMVFLSATVEPPKWMQTAVVCPSRIHPTSLKNVLSNSLQL